MSFISAVQSIEPADKPPYLIIFIKSKVLVVSKKNIMTLPSDRDIEIINDQVEQNIFVGTLNQRPCYAMRLSPAHPHPADMETRNLRELIALLDQETFKAVMTASQILTWDYNFRFCGHCGTPVEDKPLERAKKCPKCGLTAFPRISPAIMVAIVKDDHLLLARGRNFPPGMYSVLAGFVEPGETLEECVVREVREEVGLEIQDLTYFSSQFWPFPDSLMIAFTARYAGGDISVDEVEIAEAGWYKAGALPDRPSSKISISGQLIDWFEDTYAGEI